MNKVSRRNSVTVGLVAVLVAVLFLLGWPGLRVQAGNPLDPIDVSLRLPPISITVDEQIASGLDHPVYITNAADGSNRLFVVEQRGRIRIVENGAVVATPFLDIASKVLYGGERGLLSVAFPPNYAEKGYFYVDYTRQPDGNTVIARYRITGDLDVADAASEEVLLTIYQPYSNHNGGQLAFGPGDGYLYVGMGDGGSSGDPLDNAQNTNTLLGKILRIDVESSINPYLIPADNPYVNTSGYRGEIWALGVRNPWRFGFDRETRDLYIGDVGQNAWEEIDFEGADSPGGLNWGWRCKEGTHDYNFSGSCATLSLVEPVAEYSHSVGQSVTGGYVYRGVRYPALRGRYFYADYVRGLIWSVYETSENPVAWSTPELELDTALYISSFGEDEDGEVFVVDYYGGTIRRLADANGPSPDLSSSEKMAVTPYADPGEVVTYTLHLRNSGNASPEMLWLTDTVPAGLAYRAGSLAASSGTASDSASPVLIWQGTMGTAGVVTITYEAVVAATEGSITNEAQVTGERMALLTLSDDLFVPRPVLTTTSGNFFMPGTQPAGLDDQIAASGGCDFCHTAPIYDRWRGATMSQAGRDPLMWAAMSIANNSAPGAGEYCLRCHTSKGWLEGRSSPSDGTALNADDIDPGVSCTLCHRLVDPVASIDDEAVGLDASIRSDISPALPAGHMGSAMMIVDPVDNRRGPFKISPPPPHTAYQTDFLGRSTEYVARARICGTCHNLDNPLLSWNGSEYWGNPSGQPASSFDKGDLFPIERTFDEWLNSEYASSGVLAPQFAGSKPSGIVGACQDCHMWNAIGKAAEDYLNPTERDCEGTGCLAEHGFVGGNSWISDILQDSRWRLSESAQAPFLEATLDRTEAMLSRAATMTGTLWVDGAQKTVSVRVFNQTGHKLPTGYPEGRRIWLNLRAYDGEGNVIYESGAYDKSTGVLTQDADIKVYEIKQGMTVDWANHLDLPPGESFYFALNNTTIRDNRIPPRGYTQAAFDQPGLRPIGVTYADGQYWDDTNYEVPDETEHFLATLYYQTASKEYIDFLRTLGGVDGAALGSLWDASKSPPRVIASAANFPPSYLPILLKNATF